ncbi:MAG TPA: hypothetical protein VGH33_12340, partial [Isosphaeraceae bacterium]
MSEPSLIEREVGVLDSLNRNASERAAGEAKLTGELATRGVTIEAEYRSARRTLEQKAAQALQKVKGDTDAELSAIKAKAKADQDKTRAEYDAATKAYKQKFANETGKAKKVADDTRWNTSAVYDSGKGEVKKYYEATTRSLANDEQNRQTLETEANGLLAKYKRFIKPGATVEAAAAAPEPADAPKPEGEDGAKEVEAPPTVITEYRDAIHAIDEHLIAFHKLGTIKALQPGAFAFVAIMLIAVPAVIGLFAAGTVGAIGGGVGGLVLAVLLFLGLSAIAKKGVTKVAVPLRFEVERAARLADEAKAWLEADHQARKDAIENRRESELKRA